MNYKLIIGFVALSIGQCMAVNEGDVKTKVSVPSDKMHQGPKAPKVNNENAPPSKTQSRPTLNTNSQSQAGLKVRNQNTVKTTSSTKPAMAKVPSKSTQTSSQQQPSSQSQTRNPSPARESSPAKSHHSQSRSSSTSKSRQSQSPMKQMPPSSQQPSLKPSLSKSSASMSKQSLQASSSSSGSFPSPPSDVEPVLRGVLNIANAAIGEEAQLQHKLSTLNIVNKASIDNLKEELKNSNPKSGARLADLPVMIFNVLKTILTSKQFKDYVNYGKGSTEKFVRVVNSTLKVFVYLFNIPALPQIDPLRVPETASEVIRELGTRINTDEFKVNEFLQTNKEGLNKALDESQVLKGDGGEPFGVDQIMSHLQGIKKGPSLVEVRN